MSKLVDAKRKDFAKLQAEIQKRGEQRRKEGLCMECGMPLIRDSKHPKRLGCINPECSKGQIGIALGETLPQPPQKYPTIQDRIRRKISKR